MRGQVPQKDLPRQVHGVTDRCEPKSRLEEDRDNSTVIVIVSKLLVLM